MEESQLKLPPALGNIPEKMVLYMMMVYLKMVFNHQKNWPLDVGDIMLWNLGLLCFQTNPYESLWVPYQYISYQLLVDVFQQFYTNFAAKQKYQSYIKL